MASTWGALADSFCHYLRESRAAWPPPGERWQTAFVAIYVSPAPLGLQLGRAARQYINYLRSTEIISAVQKLSPQYRNYLRNTEIISAVQKLSPQYRIYLRSTQNSLPSTEIISAVQKLSPQYRNYLLSTEMISVVHKILPPVQKLSPQYNNSLAAPPLGSSIGPTGTNHELS